MQFCDFSEQDALHKGVCKVTLSVIVPVYNVASYLEECVASILSQTFRDFELILIDDGSTDGSGNMCEALARKDARIVVVHQRNQGLSAARNTGIERARGEYFAFVDSDDYLEREMFQKQMEASRRYDADLVMCRFRKVDRRHKHPSTKGIDAEQVIGHADAMAMVMKDREIKSHAWDKLARRHVFDGVRYPVGRVYEDMATTYKIFDKANCVVTLPYVGYNYRQNTGGITNVERHSARWIRNEVDVIVAWKERYCYAKERASLAALVPFCGGKTYVKCLRFLDTCLRHGICLSENTEQKIAECMTAVDYDNLESVPFKFRKSIWLLRSKIKIWRFWRMLTSIGYNNLQLSGNNC